MAKIVQNPRLRYRCPYCDILFCIKADCLTHIKIEHDVNLSWIPLGLIKHKTEEKEKLDKSVGPVKCPNCHGMIISERILVLHLGNCKPKNGQKCVKNH